MTQHSILMPRNKENEIPFMKSYNILFEEYKTAHKF